jgi:hypothetical protein
MKNLKVMIIGAGLLAMSAVETLAKEITTADVVEIENAYEARTQDVLNVFEATATLQPEVLKVPIYSVPLPNENKIVLVRDPKGFVERAIRHNMEYLAIKPGEKGEYWELMPVFANEPNSLSFDLKKTPDEGTAEAQDEVLRVVPVKDFIRYN